MLNVRCDNALKFNQVFNVTDSGVTREKIKVREGSSCGIVFTDFGQHDEDFFQVKYGDNSTSEEIVLFEGGGFADSDTIFFGAFSRFLRLVPITLLLELFENQLGFPGDIAVRVSCDDGFETYFRVSNDGHSTSHTVQVPREQNAKYCLRISITICAVKITKVLSRYCMERIRPTLLWRTTLSAVQMAPLSLLQKFESKAMIGSDGRSVCVFMILYTTFRCFYIPVRGVEVAAVLSRSKTLIGDLY